MAGSFRELEAWRGGMELVVLVFDLTAGLEREGRGEAGDALRLAALEVPQEIAAGAVDGRPKPWRRSLAQALGALDRLEAEARRLWALQDRRLLELVAHVRRELRGLQDVARPEAA